MVITNPTDSAPMLEMAEILEFVFDVALLPVWDCAARMTESLYALDQINWIAGDYG